MIDLSKHRAWYFEHGTSTYDHTARGGVVLAPTARQAQTYVREHRWPLRFVGEDTHTPEERERIEVLAVWPSGYL